MRKLSKWRQEIERKLITQAQLARRVRDLARQIERDFAGRDLVVVSLLNGTVMFLADLLRHLPLPMRLDFIGVSSYREGRHPRHRHNAQTRAGQTARAKAPPRQSLRVAGIESPARGKGPRRLRRFQHSGPVCGRLRA